MAVSLEQFVRHLTNSGLLSAAEVTSFQDSVPPEKRPNDAETFARDLVRAGKLTKYQAQAVYQGKTKSLVFGEYRVLDKLGEGGMGVVLLAEHRRMERRVAVKRIAGAALRSPNAVKRFYQEVKAAAKLMHPNIVAAHDAGEHEGGHYLVMEYVDGKDLAALAEERGPLPVTQAVDYVLQAARGLQYAHKQGIIHRDIKPSNLLLDKEGHVKILDMGLARIGGLADSDEKDRLTACGKVMGTCDYIAPEQALDARTADHRADIYSLGCTLYRLVTGKPPYEGESLVQILLAHREAPIPSLGRLGSDAHAELDRVFQKMVAKRPEDRYQSMAEVVGALEAFLRRGPVEWSSDQAGGWDAARSEPASRNTGAVPQSSFSLRSLMDEGPTPASPRPLAGEGAGVRRTRRLPRYALVKRFLAAARNPETRVATIGLGLMGLAGVVLILFIAITSRVRQPDGTETSVAVPSGSQATVSAQADVDVALQAESGKRKAESGKPKGDGGEPKAESEKRKAESEKPKAESEKRKAESEKPKAEPSSPVPGPPPPAPQPPPPAVAQFDPAKAKQHQQDWAKRLRVPVVATNSIGMKLVLIPPGEFEMGSTREETAWALEHKLDTPQVKRELADWEPRHHVKLTRPFGLGMYPVTQDEYKKIMRVNPSAFSSNQMRAPTLNPQAPSEGGWDKKMRASMARAAAGKITGNYPVETVAWADCVEFCRRLSAVPAERAAGRVYRLPTEAEWEYACRAETTTRWYFGDDAADLGEYAWSGLNSGVTAHPVGQKKPNAWGLYDMHGLVWQWCSDRFGGYQGSSAVDPTGPERGDLRVCRGGCFRNGSIILLSAYRGNAAPNDLVCTHGFRVVVEIADQDVGPAVSAETAPARGTAGQAGPTSESGKPKAENGGPSAEPPSPAPGLPSPAVASFDAAKAKQHQAAWAKHLGAPVERTNSIGMKLVLIPPGEFEMGSTPEERADKALPKRDIADAEPRHHVKLTKAFYLGMYLVTQDEYTKVMRVNPSAFSAVQPRASTFNPQARNQEQWEKKLRPTLARAAAGKATGNYPVETVSWVDCVEFCRRLSAVSAERAAGRVYRLPTEAEWEYACRAGTTTPWYCGDNAADLRECAWFSDNSGDTPHPVGQKKPNAWGLYDMHGLVWQWCSDWFGGYQGSSAVDPTGPERGDTRVLRGGCFRGNAIRLRSAWRVPNMPNDVSCLHGFRVVVEMPIQGAVGKGQ